MSVAVYAWIGGRAAVTGGKVQVKNFGLPDLLVGGLLAAFLALACFQPPVKAEKITLHGLADGAIVELTAVAFICSFLYFRGFNLSAQFGLRAVRPDKAAGLAVLLLLAAFPLLGWIATFVENYSHGQQQQQLIQFFSKAVSDHNRRAVACMFITATVIAPVAEELVFRGYLYGIIKRYLGAGAGMALSAALFAGVHQTPAALPELFALAVCLTLAYEYTGSILVNMCMHGLFNFCSLALVYYHPIPAGQ